jgi:cytochrome c556
MRRFLTYVLAVTVMSSVALMAQKVTTVEELDKTMKRVGPAQGALNKAIQSMQYADARKQLAIEKAALQDALNFWVINKKDDAIKLANDNFTRLDELDKVLAGNPDIATATAAFKAMGATCGACHKAYREQLPDETYRLRPGSI